MEEIILKQSTTEIIKFSILNNSYVSIFTENISKENNVTLDSSLLANIPIKNIGTIQFKTHTSVSKTIASKIVTAINIVLILLLLTFILSQNSIGVSITFLLLLGMITVSAILYGNNKSTKQELIIKNNNEEMIVQINCELSNNQCQSIIDSIRTLQ